MNPNKLTTARLNHGTFEPTERQPQVLKKSELMKRSAECITQLVSKRPKMKCH